MQYFDMFIYLSHDKKKKFAVLIISIFYQDSINYIVLILNLFFLRLNQYEIMLRIEGEGNACIGSKIKVYLNYLCEISLLILTYTLKSYSLFFIY